MKTSSRDLKEKVVNQTKDFLKAALFGPKFEELQQFSSDRVICHFTYSANSKGRIVVEDKTKRGGSIETKMTITFLVPESSSKYNQPQVQLTRVVDASGEFPLSAKVNDCSAAFLRTQKIVNLVKEEYQLADFREKQHKQDLAFAGQISELGFDIPPGLLGSRIKNISSKTRARVEVINSTAQLSIQTSDFELLRKITALVNTEHNS